MSWTVEFDAEGKTVLPSACAELLGSQCWLVVSSDQAFLMSDGHDKKIREKIEDADAAKERLKALQRSGQRLSVGPSGELECPEHHWELFSKCRFHLSAGRAEGVFRLEKQA